MTLTILIAFSFLWAGEGTGAPPAKNKKTTVNTQIYEKAKNESTFTATVKIVREIQDTWDVMFDGHPGYYVIDVADQQALLSEAHKSKQNVTVRVDEDTNHVLSVKLAPAHTN